MKELTQRQIKKIRRNADKLNWWNLSRHNQFPIRFMREFKKRIRWGYVVVYQKLSDEMVLEFKTYLYSTHCLWLACRKHNYHNIKLYVKHGMKLNNKCIKELMNQF
ncbi:hypothetical protein KY334_05790 [Candidatus Woesearchaeota archaeon]|nr:hypothetical protein [Candidatus Woesearchaeota archaeon]